MSLDDSLPDESVPQQVNGEPDLDGIPWHTRPQPRLDQRPDQRSVADHARNVREHLRWLTMQYEHAQERFRDTPAWRPLLQIRREAEMAVWKQALDDAFLRFRGRPSM